MSILLSSGLRAADLILKNCDFRILQLLKVKVDAGTLSAMLSFQLQLEGCYHNWCQCLHQRMSLLMLDLKHCGTRMKSIQLWTCPLDVPGLVRVSLWRCRVLAKIRKWLLANSSSLRSLSLISLLLSSSRMHLALLWHSNPFVQWWFYMYIIL